MESAKKVKNAKNKEYPVKNPKISGETLLSGWYTGTAKNYDEAIKDILDKPEFNWYSYRLKLTGSNGFSYE